MAKYCILSLSITVNVLLSVSINLVNSAFIVSVSVEDAGGADDGAGSQDQGKNWSQDIQRKSGGPAAAATATAATAARARAPPSRKSSVKTASVQLGRRCSVTGYKSNGEFTLVTYTGAL